MKTIWEEGIIFWEKNLIKDGVIARINQGWVIYQTTVNHTTTGKICFSRDRKMPIGFATFDGEDETAFEDRDNFFLVKSTPVRGELPDLSVVANEALKFNSKLATIVDHFYKIKAPTFEGYIVDDVFYTMINGNLIIEDYFELYQYGEAEKTQIPIAALIEAATKEENNNE